MGLAVRVPFEEPVAGPRDRRDPSAPCLSRHGAARRQAFSSGGADHEARGLPHSAAFLRDAPPSVRPGHPHGARTAWAFRCVDDHDLHPRHEQGCAWGEEPARPPRAAARGIPARARAGGGLSLAAWSILVSSVMLPEDFHPILQRWWETHFRDPGSARVLPPTAARLEGWRSIRSGRHTLIAAPTGSGKTLAAFLTSIDQLLRESLEAGELPDEVRVIYVSPLKALSADIHKDLAERRREMRRIAEETGSPPVGISAAVRSGDTPQGERAAMLRSPPHILVTTPESLYLLLTAERSREMLKTARVVIVDEIHAVLQSRRGAHLALSLERLDHVCGRPLQRIGLSATQKPIEEVARFLTRKPCSIVDKGHRRKMDLAVEVPRSPLEAVMSHEVWADVYERLVQLIDEHR